MASIKVKFRRSSANSNPNAEGTIYYQVIHDRKVRQLRTSYRITNSEWDERRHTLSFAGRTSADRTRVLHEIKRKMRSDIERIHKIVKRLDDLDYPYSSDDIVDNYREYCREY